jgi:hypothetical protein
MRIEWFYERPKAAISDIFHRSTLSDFLTGARYPVLARRLRLPGDADSSYLRSGSGTPMSIWAAAVTGRRAFRAIRERQSDHCSADRAQRFGFDLMVVFRTPTRSDKLRQRRRPRALRAQCDLERKDRPVLPWLSSQRNGIFGPPFT